jgi:hypothetical protein
MLEMEVSMTRMRRSLAVIVIGSAVGLAASAAAAFSSGAFTARAHVAAAPQAAVGACASDSAARLAATTQQGGQVLVVKGKGRNAACLIYQDANGAWTRTFGVLGDTPAGAGLALKALDTVTNTYVLVVAVPDGFNHVANGSSTRAIANNVFVLDAAQAPDTVAINGPAGTRTLNLAAFH